MPLYDPHHYGQPDPGYAQPPQAGYGQQPAYGQPQQAPYGNQPGYQTSYLGQVGSYPGVGRYQRKFGVVGAVVTLIGAVLLVVSYLALNPAIPMPFSAGWAG